MSDGQHKTRSGLILAYAILELRCISSKVPVGLGWVGVWAVALSQFPLPPLDIEQELPRGAPKP